MYVIPNQSSKMQPKNEQQQQQNEYLKGKTKPETNLTAGGTIVIVRHRY